MKVTAKDLINRLNEKCDGLTEIQKVIDITGETYKGEPERAWLSMKQDVEGFIGWLEKQKDSPDPRLRDAYKDSYRISNDILTWMEEQTEQHPELFEMALWIMPDQIMIRKQGTEYKDLIRYVDGEPFVPLEDLITLGRLTDEGFRLTKFCLFSEE